MAEDILDILRDAITRNTGAVISLPGGGVALSPHKTRFLAEGEGGIWIQSIAGREQAIDHVIETQALVGLAFKSAITKVIFTTTLWRRQPDFKVNDQLRVEAILMAFPASLKSVQRRNAYRVCIPPDSMLSLTVWRIAEKATLEDQPASIMLWPMRIHDLSIGGMGVLTTCPEGRQPQHFNDQRLRIVVSYGPNEVLLDARIKHIRETGGSTPMRMGIKFAELEGGAMENRQALSKLTAIVGQLHREEVRRLHLGLTA